MDSRFLTLRQLLLSGRIRWVKSQQTLRKWVERDKNGSNHLKAVEIGSGRSKRYYFLKENVEAFVRAFESGEIILRSSKNED